MDLSFSTYIIVGIFVFIAGFVDAIAGGGVLISLPAYMAVGLPPYKALATNKLSNACGTTLAVVRFIKAGLVNFKIVIPSIIFAILGSTLGAHLALLTDPTVLEKLMFVILPITAFFVFNKKLFRDYEQKEVITDKRTMLVCLISSFVIGIYDGFYGPGTGTFLLIALSVFGHMSIANANGQVKAINLATNVSALVVYLLNGQVLITLGLFAAACNMLGNYIGAGMMMKNGTKIVKPIIAVVLILLFLKILHVF